MVQDNDNTMSYKSVQLQVGEGFVEDAVHAKVRRICRCAGLSWINKKDVSQQIVWKPGRESIASPGKQRNASDKG